MRYALLLATVALACAADPVLLPDASPPADAGPCGGACGAGTVCEGGACVAVDAGAVDAGTADSGGGADVVDVPAVDTPPMDLGAPDVGAADGGFDAPPVVDRAPPMVPDGSYFREVGACEGCGVANATCVCGDGGLIYTCRAGFAECDGQYATGCEARLEDNAANCGACGNACVSGLNCRAGRCR